LWMRILCSNRKWCFAFRCSVFASQLKSMLLPLAPFLHEPLLLCRLRRHTPATLLILLPKPLQHLKHVPAVGKPVPNQPAANHGACPTHAAPAVDVRRGPIGCRLVDLVEDLEHQLLGRNGQVLDSKTPTIGVGAKLPSQFVVRSKGPISMVGLVFLHQIDQRADARVEQSLDLAAMLIWIR